MLNLTSSGEGSKEANLKIRRKEYIFTALNMITLMTNKVVVMMNGAEL